MIDFDMLAVGSTVLKGSGSRLIQPRMRVIIDNDFSGDPDDLFALVHHVLSPSIEIPLIIGSHLSVGDEWDPSNVQARMRKRGPRKHSGSWGSNTISGCSKGLIPDLMTGGRQSHPPPP